MIISWLILPPVWIDACPGGSGPPPPAPPPPCISEYRDEGATHNGEIATARNLSEQRGL